MTVRGFPRRITWSNWGGLMCDVRLFRPLARIACARHGLSFQGMRPGFPGTCAVFRVAAVKPDEPFYVKFYPSIVRKDYARELAVLKLMEGRRISLVPGLLGHGTLEVGGGWPYLIVREVGGKALREALRLIPRAEAVGIARQAGRWLRSFNLMRFAPGEARASGFRLWRDFLAERKRRFPAELRRIGFAAAGFMGEATRRIRGIDPLRSPRLVNGDLTEDHVMVSRARGGWRLSGVIDFADALVGDSWYELAPVWLGTFQRRPDLMRGFLRSFMPGTAVTPAWRDRAAAFTVIHLFGARMISAALRMDRKDPREFASWAEFRDWLWPAFLNQRGTKRK